MSVVALGLAVDSSQVNAATRALDGLTAAAKPAQGAANLLKQSFAALQGSLAQLISIQQASLSQQSAMVSAFDKLSQSLSKVNQTAPAIVSATTAIDQAAKPAAVSVTATGKALDVVTTAAKPVVASVTSAEKALVDLTKAAKPAVQAANDLGKASSTATTGALSLSNAANKAATGGAKALAVQTGLARHELVNLSRQLQDVGVSLASGQSPFTVLVQQGTQVADIFGSSKTGTVGGAMRQIGSGIASVLTPMRVLGIAVAAAGAAAYVAYGSWKSYTLQLDDAARAAGTTTASLSKLQAAASVKGIDPAEFNKGIQSFASSVYDAKNNMGELAQVFRANNVHASNFDDAMGKAADLIQRAKDDQQRLQLLQQMGLPATMEWVRLLSGGAAGLNAAKDAMAEFSANDDMVKKAREFDEAWNKAWTNFGLNARSAFQTALDVGSTLFDRMEKLAAQAGNASFWNKFIPANMKPEEFGLTSVGGDDLANSRVRGGFDEVSKSPSNPALQSALQKRAGTSDGTVDPRVLQDRIQKEQQRLGLLGQTITATEAMRLVQLQADQASANGVAVDQKRIDVLKKLAYEQSIGVTQIKASIDSYNIEAATIGMSAGAATQYAAAQNAINEARRSGRALTQDNIAAINAQAAALGEAAAKADLMQSAYSGLVRGPLQTLTSQIANGAKFFDALKSAGISALNAIASKLAEMAAQSLWTNALGGATGGSGGGLIGGIMSLFKNADGNVFPANDNGISRYSSQIVDRPTMFPFAKGIGLMGEAGPEAIMPLRRGPDGKLGVAASGGGGGESVTVPITVSIDATGADAAGLRRVEQQVADLKANLPGMTVQAVQSAKKRRVAGL